LILDFSEGFVEWEFLDNFSGSDIFIFPTETVYGIGTIYDNFGGIERIFELKKRDDKPLALYFSSIFDVEEYVVVRKRARRVMEGFLPGPLTVVLNQRRELHPKLVKNGKVGIRVPNFSIINKILDFIKKPVAATSANLSGEPPTSIFEKIDDRIISEVSFAIKGDNRGKIPPTTVVDLTGDQPIILREGSIGLDEMLGVWNL